MTCGHVVVFSVNVMVLVLHICNFELALLIVQHIVYRASGPDVVAKDDCRLCFLFQIV